MSGQTIAEKILAAHSISDSDIKTGEIINARLDLVMSHIGTGKVLMDFNKIRPSKKRKIFDPNKIVVLFDHYVPAPSERWAGERNVVFLL